MSQLSSVVGMILLTVATYLYVKGEKQDAIYFAVLATSSFVAACLVSL